MLRALGANLTTVYVVVALGLVFFGIAAFSVYKIERERATTALVIRTSVWLIHQIEIELLRTKNTLDRFAAGLPDTDAKDVQLRFDILWSRIPVASTGLESEWLRTARGANEELRDLRQALESFDPVIRNLAQASAPSILAIGDQIGEHISRIHEISVDLHVGSHRQAILKELVERQHETAIVIGALTVVGGVIVVLLMFSVRANRKAAEQERAMRIFAENASQAKSQFLASMSHELRTPLNAVMGYSEMIRDKLLGEAESGRYEEYADHIYRSGGHLLGLIDDILDLTRIEEGKIVPDERPFDIRQNIDWCIDLIRARSGETTAEIIADIPDALPAIFGDERLIRQILLNLMSNAAKFTPDSGTISVSVALPDSGGLDVCIADTGIGIAAKDLACVFQPFAQVEGVMTKSKQGVGLGLTISRHFAELHDATLELSSALNEGTRATLRFPASRIVHQPN